MATWVYVSIATDRRFLGACIVEGSCSEDGIVCDVERFIDPAWRDEPGLEWVAFEIRKAVPPESFRNRILTKEEILVVFPDAISVGDYRAKKAGLS